MSYELKVKSYMKKVFLMMAVVAMALVSCGKENVNESDDISQQIIGKWMLSKMDGNAVPTNAKVVYTFESTTNGYISASRADYNADMTRWTDHAPSAITVDGKKISMKGDLNKTTSFEAEIEVKTINSSETETDSKYTVYHNGAPLYVSEGTAVWAKVTKDFGADILGVWEGHVTNNEGSEFDDGELHRWEYFADGTYIYYHLDADSNWVAQASELSEYFVDGTLLCTRWKNSGEGEVENREWWEIASITGGVMKWTALRQRDDGTTYTATFQMTKVQ